MEPNFILSQNALTLTPFKRLYSISNHLLRERKIMGLHKTMSHNKQRYTISITIKKDDVLLGFGAV
jgi:hypothetical protein